MSKELSVIIPFVNEYPQVAFTLQSLMCELNGHVDYEIIAIDNWCDEVADQGRERDKGYDHLVEIQQRFHPDRLVVMEYRDRLSHWQAKNVAMAAARAEILFHIDAHCVMAHGSLVRMFRHYREHHHELDTLNLPYLYLLDKPDAELIYRPKWNFEEGDIDHAQSHYHRRPEPHSVPCASMCGHMTTRTIMRDVLGGFPSELGIYGGGEHFVSYTLGVLGRKMNIFPDDGFYHFAEKRGYHWNYNDYTKNRCCANYMWGGEEWASRYIQHRKGDPAILQKIYEQVIENGREQRLHIESQQQLQPEEFFARWEDFQT